MGEWAKFSKDASDAKGEKSVMKHRPQSIDEWELLIPRYARVAVRNAYRKTMASEGFVIKVQDGFLVKANADGTFVRLKRLTDPTGVKKGDRVRIERIGTL